MPDIGLLQGPDRPRLSVVPATVVTPPLAEAASAETASAETASADAALTDAARPVVRESPPPELPENAQRVAARSAPAEFAILRAPREPEAVIEIAASEPVVVVSEAVDSSRIDTTMPSVAAATSAHVPVLVVVDASRATPAEPKLPDRFMATPPVVAAPGPHDPRWQDLAWLALALLLIVGTGLGIRDPWPADEPRFAAIARDMVLSHEWLFPRVGGDLYQDKPPLFFWLLAAGYALTGSVKASFLIPSFLAAGAVLFLVYDLGRRLVDRAAALAAAVLVCVTLQFVVTMRGAQIDPLLCGLTTLSLYGLLRHLLLGPRWGWYALGGFAAGLGVITKGVGFLPMLLLVPFFLMRKFEWRNLCTERGGWKWWLAPLAMLIGIGLWFVPMLLAVAAHGPGEYAAYRDEILFHQTVGRYAASWHHVKGWYYFLVEVIPPLWLPWSVLLFWLVPRYRRAWVERDARVWLPLAWVCLVLLFFSASPGKRGVYINPAVPALALASLPFLGEVLAKREVRIASLVFAALAIIAGLVLTIAPQIVPGALTLNPMVWPFVVITAALVALAMWRKPVAAYAATIAGLALWFSYFLAPRMNGERSGSDFTRAVLTQVATDEQLALVAYKEQFLLYLDRPTVNFGHRRFLEGPQEAYDAAAWLDAAPNRVLLVPSDQLAPCFSANARLAGEASDDRWYLVRSPADADCAAKGHASRAIYYQPRLP